MCTADFTWTRQMDFALGSVMQEEGLNKLAELRREIGSSFAYLDISLLRPMCWDCERNLWGIEDDDPLRPARLIRVLPSSQDISCSFDRANQYVKFSIDKEAVEPYSLSCWRCGADLDICDGETIPGYPVSFAEYFQIPESGPIKPPASFKRRLKAVYGNKCIQCKRDFKQEDLTVDHILARAAGGDGSALNLQVLCLSCNQSKADQPVRTLELYLDLLLRAYDD